MRAFRYIQFETLFKLNKHRFVKQLNAATLFSSEKTAEDSLKMSILNTQLFKIVGVNIEEITNK
jgi:hypothetical protein